MTDAARRPPALYSGLSVYSGTYTAGHRGVKGSGRISGWSGVDAVRYAAPLDTGSVEHAVPERGGAESPSPLTRKIAQLTAKGWRVTLAPTRA